SHVIASVVPNCVSYDPTFSFELTVIVHEGLRRMVTNREDVFYYITVMNENYAHPGIEEVADKNAQANILKGTYLSKEGAKPKGKTHVQLMGSGTIFREVIAAADLLEADWGVTADIWSCPGFNELRRDGLDTDRWNMLHPTEAPRLSHVEQCLKDREGPAIAATDYMK